MTRRALRSTFAIISLLAAWELLAYIGVISSELFPPPSTVGSYLFLHIRDGSLLTATATTLSRLIAGFALGVLVGLPLGLSCARSTTLRDTLGTIAIGFQSLPSACWVPPALLWFGDSELAMLFVVVSGCLWSVLLATCHGVEQVPPIYLRAARTLGSTGFHTVFFVMFPSALPSIIQGMKQGWAFAWRALMAAEIYVTLVSGTGLGNLLNDARRTNSMAQLIGVMAIIMLSGYAVDRLLFGRAERYLQKRWGIGGSSAQVAG